MPILLGLYNIDLFFSCEVLELHQFNSVYETDKILYLPLAICFTNI